MLRAPERARRRVPRRPGDPTLSLRFGFFRAPPRSLSRRPARRPARRGAARRYGPRACRYDAARRQRRRDALGRRRWRSRPARVTVLDAEAIGIGRGLVRRRPARCALGRVRPALRGGRASQPIPPRHRREPDARPPRRPPHRRPAARPARPVAAADGAAGARRDSPRRGLGALRDGRRRRRHRPPHGAARPGPADAREHGRGVGRAVASAASPPSRAVRFPRSSPPRRRRPTATSPSSIQTQGLDGATLRRDGADRALHSVYARVELAPDGPTRGQLAAWVGAAERGLPGSVGSASQDERQWDRHLRVWGDVTSRLGPVALRAGGLVQRASLRYRNAALGLDDTGRTWIGSGEVEARALVAPGVGRRGRRHRRRRDGRASEPARRRARDAARRLRPRDGRSRAPAPLPRAPRRRLPPVRRGRADARRAQPAPRRERAARRRAGRSG